MYGVPMFLLISGALLLNRDIDIKDFLKRRMSRIIYPFILYLIIFVSLLYFLMTNFAGFGPAASSLAKVPFEYNWYFWLILGLYFIVPIINIFVRHASKKELDYFMLVLFGGSIFYQIMFILGITHYVNLNFILCPVAYLVLGYFLANHEFKMSKSKLITLSILLFIIVSVIKIIAVDGVIPFEYVTGYDITTSPRVATKVDLGIFELIRSSALFILIKCIFESSSGIYSKVKNIFENNIVERFYSSISRASYGMYLFNGTLLVILKCTIVKLPHSGTQVCLFIIALFFAYNILCWLVVLIINRIPFINKFSGYY